MLVSGEAADRYAEILAGLGADVAVQPGPVGTAISRKLLRSVFYKGLAAAVVEALRGAEAAGCADWLRANIAAELAGFDERTVDRLVDGTHTHARRRADEMAAATEQLRGAGRPGAHRGRRPGPADRAPRRRHDCADNGERMIIDCHGHYTTAPAAHTAWREQQVRPARRGRRRRPTRRSATTRSGRPIESSQLRLMDERGIDVTLFSPRASAMAPHVGDAAVSLEWSRRLQRPGAPGGDALPGPLRPRLPAAAVARRADLAGVDRRAAPVRGGARLRRLQPQPGPQRRVLDLAAADRPQLVPVLRGDGRAGRAGDGARLGVGQPGVPRDGRVLHQRRHDGLHAAACRATCSPTCPDLRLVIPHGGGAVPYHWGRYRGLADMLGQPPVRVQRHGQRLLRHLRLPPAGHRPAAATSSTSRTSCSAPRWSAPCAASTRGPATTTTTPGATSRPRREPGRRGAHRGLRGQRPPRLPPARRGAGGPPGADRRAVRSSRGPAGGRWRRRTRRCRRPRCPWRARTPPGTPARPRSPGPGAPRCRRRWRPR